MESQRMKHTLVAAALVGCGYLLGASVPNAMAYTQDETRLLNRISNNLDGINRSLQTIARKIE